MSLNLEIKTPTAILKPFGQKSRGLDDAGNTYTSTRDQTIGFKTAQKQDAVPVHPIPPGLIWETWAPFLRREVLCVKMRRSPMR